MLNAPFTIAKHSTRRLHMINETGIAQYEKSGGQDDVSYLQALTDGTDTGAPSAANQDQVEDAPPDPQQAIELFQTALGECDVMVDVVSNLVAQRHLDYKLMSSKRSAQAVMHSAVMGRLLRAGLRRESLVRAGDTLRRGAAALREVADMDNRFHTQVSRLQHYWSIRRTPPGAHPAAPYLIDLTLGHLSPTNIPAAGTPGAPPSSAGSQPSGTAPGRTGPGRPATGASSSAPTGGPNQAASDVAITGGTLASMLPSLPAVPLLRGPGGALQLALPPPLALTSDGEVAVGLRAVHTALLGAHTRLVWAVLLDTCEGECGGATTAGGNPFTLRLVRLLARLLTVHPRLCDPVVATLRPVLLEHVLALRLPPVTLGSAWGTRGGTAGSASGPAPLSWPLRLSVTLMSHLYAREGLWHALWTQACGCEAVGLQWVPCGRLGSSAVRVWVRGQPTCLITVQDTVLEVDGVVCGAAAGTGWAHDGHTTVARQELPYLLPRLVLGRPPGP